MVSQCKISKRIFSTEEVLSSIQDNTDSDDSSSKGSRHTSEVDYDTLVEIPLQKWPKIADELAGQLNSIVLRL
jgi:stalled ribosome rescue protein Dom34